MTKRYLLGQIVASMYALVGMRTHSVAGYRNNGQILSIFGHNPSAEVLASLIKALIKRGFSFVSTDELIAMSNGDTAWSPYTAWLSFDDGWSGFEGNVLPVLKRYNVPATIFVAPGETARGNIWTNSVMEFISVEEWTRWYRLPAAERYEKVEDVLANRNVDRHLADSDELKRLAGEPLVTLENHTYTHLSCSSRPVDEVAEEIERTSHVLTEWTGRKPRLCCYPFGHWNAQSDGCIRDLGLIPVKSDPGRMTLETIGACRNMFHDTMSLSENLGRVLGAWPKIHSPRVN